MDIDIDVFSRTFRSSDGYGRGTGMRPSDSLLNDWIIGGRRRKNQKSASKKLDGFAVRTNSVVPILSLGPWTVVTSPSPNYLSSVKKHPAGPPPPSQAAWPWRLAMWRGAHPSFWVLVGLARASQSAFILGSGRCVRAREDYSGHIALSPKNDLLAYHHLHC